MAAYVILIRNNPPHDPAKMAAYGKKLVEFRLTHAQAPRAVWRHGSARGQPAERCSHPGISHVRRRTELVLQSCLSGGCSASQEGRGVRAFIVQGL